MYVPHDLSGVNLSLSPPPSKILLMQGGQAVEWQPADIATTPAGVYLFIANMAAQGFTALRDGDSIVLHPMYGQLPAHLEWVA